MIKKLNVLLNFPKDIYLFLISYFPGPIGFFLRFRFWKSKLKHLGSRVRIDVGVYFQNPDFIYIDDNCWLDRNVIIMAGLDITEREILKFENDDYKFEPGVVHVGKNVHIAPGCILSGISGGIYIADDCCIAANCKIYSFSHHYRSHKKPSDKSFHFGSMVPPNRQCLIVGPIFIGMNTGIALNSVLLPGVTIKENSFVSINSVVHRDKYHPNSLISGNPAKRVGNRFKEIE